MVKGNNQTRAAVLALFLSTVKTETVYEQTIANNALNANQQLIADSNQEMALESFVDGTESALNPNESDSSSQIK